MLAALWPLTIGHLLAMLLVILPFALLVALVEWQRQIQIGASLLVILGPILTHCTWSLTMLLVLPLVFF